MRSICFALVFAALVVPNAGAQTESRLSNNQSLDLVEDYEAYARRADPVTAGFEGDRPSLSRLPDVSPEAVALRRQALEGFKTRLGAIAPATLGNNWRGDYERLVRTVDAELERIPYDLDRLAFENDSGFFSLMGYLAAATPIRSTADAEAWISRLEATPKWYDQNIANLRRGMATGLMQPRPVVDAAMVQIRAIPANAEASPLYAPMKTMSATMPAAEAEALRTRAKAAIDNGVIPKQRLLLAFMEREYLPRAPTSLAIRDRPNGEALYAYLIRHHTTTKMTPDDVHNLGLAEVARIRARMQTVMAQASFNGTFPQFLQYLRTDPRFYAKTPEELLMRASEIAKRADDRLPGLFGALPRLPYGVRPVPGELAPTYTTGRYNPGSPQSGVAGGYMVNTSKLDQRPLYELPALTLHEAVPGHHLQIALAQERTDLPWHRRNADVTAFVEGWGLYAEFLGEEMGIYRDPYELFGRLSYEMWRACRLVADTGIHWKRWSLPQARKCFEENSALAPHNITTELERYVSWPGQALGYKIGEIEIRRLRAKAEAALGPDFDVRSFHDAVLREGAVPLDLLEAQIDAWIAVQKRRAGIAG
jgi:uncharacterized protein (DUF885 family)